jgi:hypothetical protein
MNAKSRQRKTEIENHGLGLFGGIWRCRLQASPSMDSVPWRAMGINWMVHYERFQYERIRNNALS